MTEAFDRGRAFRLFKQALELEGAARDRFIDDSCAHDAPLRSEIDALLAVAIQGSVCTGTLLGAAPTSAERLIGSKFGRFRLVEFIGEGGMGVVYRAERTDGVPQSVALKILTAGVSRARQARFAREVQLLARLEHPAVARLIDAGVETGRAWIAMEFVRGQRIDDYCTARDLGASDIVRLLVQLADAVAAAHGLLVVHSDIKPANVLVTPDGTPKLIDFGISIALRETDTVPSATLNATRLFSPGFAAPEQVEGGPVTVCTDVYGLGALAYRLLTRESIYPGALEPLRYMKAIATSDVTLPSRAARALGAERAQALRGDLDAILCKALERNPALRYPTATNLQEDLRRYLTHRPVSARTPTLGYRAGKFARRNALNVGLVALLATSMLTAALFMAWQSHRTSIAREMAARRGEFLENLLRSANPENGRRDVTVADLLDGALRELDRKFANEPLVEASMLGLIAQTNTALSRYPEGLAANARQLEILRTRGGGALEIGQALTARGELFRGEGKWNEAEPVLREAIGLLRGARNPAALCAAMHLLGITLAHTQREAEAESTYFEEIAMESAGDAALRQQRMHAYDSLSVLMAELGRYADALKYSRQARDVAREALPPKHPTLLSFEVTYGTALVNDHRAAAAEPVLRDVVAKQTELLGAGHHDTLLSQLVLADDLIELQRDREAAALSLSAARQLDALLGPDNLYTIMGWQEYGSAACNDHQEEAGLTALREVERARKRMLPPGNWLIHRTGASIGECLLRAKRYAEAEPLLLAAAAGLEATRGPQFRRTQEVYRALRDLYLATDRPDAARTWGSKVTAVP